MLKTINFINSFGFESILSLGVGIPSLFYDKLNAKDKIGIDKYDVNSYPRLWTQPTKQKDIKKSISKGSFEAVVINDSKHYKDLEKLFKIAENRVIDGGKIIFTHSIPYNISLVTKDFKPHQSWCGDVYEFILSIKSKGGYKIESFELDYGVTVLVKDETVEPEEIELGEFEDWFFNRKSLMNIND